MTSSPSFRARTYPVDLHLHTEVSDGVRSPEAVITHAARRGVRVAAVTDHDAVDAVGAAQAAGRGHGVFVIAGVEISCRHEGRELHLLGLGIDPQAPRLSSLLRSAQSGRQRAARHALRRLATCGVPLSRAVAEHLDRIPAPGRANLGRALVAAGHVRSVSEAFTRYLGEGRPARIHRDLPSVGEAASAIHTAGGVSLLAHPAGYPPASIREEEIEALARLGVDGIEVHHPSHSRAQAERYQEVAARLGLLASGGSDHHGYHGDRPPGAAGLTLEAFEPLARRLQVPLPPLRPSLHAPTDRSS